MSGRIPSLVPKQRHALQHRFASHNGHPTSVVASFELAFLRTPGATTVRGNNEPTDEILITRTANPMVLGLAPFGGLGVVCRGALLPIRTGRRTLSGLYSCPTLGGRLYFNRSFYGGHSAKRCSPHRGQCRRTCHLCWLDGASPISLSPGKRHRRR